MNIIKTNIEKLLSNKISDDDEREEFVEFGRVYENIFTERLDMLQSVL